MAEAPLPVDVVLTLLEQSPARIEQATASLTPAELRTCPEAGQWSAIEVLAHLRSCSDVWGECVSTILAEDRPTIRAVNPTTYVTRTDYAALDFAPSWAAYRGQRVVLLAVLRDLEPADWSRTAVVTGAGRPLERTVRSYIEWLARHERTHIKQFTRLASAR